MAGLRPRTQLLRSVLGVFLAVAFGFADSVPASAGALDRLEVALDRAFALLASGAGASEIFLDRIVALSHPERFDGTATAPSATPAVLRQVAHDLRRAATGERAAFSAAQLRERAQRWSEGEAIPLAVIDAQVKRILESGEGDFGSPNIAEPWNVNRAAFEEASVFVAAPVVAETRRGAEVRFVLPRALWFSLGRQAPDRMELDFDDGQNFQEFGFDQIVRPRWTSIGVRTVTLRATWNDGMERLGRFDFDVVRGGTPAPDDTLSITAGVAYQGTPGTGSAYVYKAPGHTAIEQPVVVVEGFDIDDSYGWDKLYELLNRENMLEDLRALGFDPIVLDFTSATDPIQRNAFVVAQLLQDLAADLDPSREIFLVGASMGGLCSRYALAWMESQAIDPRVSTFLSFDSPQNGANLPLGVQYWLDFFSGQSDDAAYLLSRLDTPAARQMLLAHHTTPPGGTGVPDPLRATFLADLATVGDWPNTSRNIAAANGAGNQAGQGFLPGTQIVRWEYRSFLVDIDGNVWAVPSPGSGTIFHGNIDFILLPADEEVVNVSGTPPLDNAPGGSRDTMFQMDTTAAPYGDILALHNRHCFIPTTSALALDSNDLFYNVAGDPNLLTHTPFEAVHFAATNEDHVFISPETKAWVIDEVIGSVTGVSELAIPTTGGGFLLRAAGCAPHPSRGSTSVHWEVLRSALVEASVFDLSGRRVGELFPRREFSPGVHSISWTPPSAGIYFLEFRAGEEKLTTRINVVSR